MRYDLPGVGEDPRPWGLKEATRGGFLGVVPSLSEVAQWLPTSSGIASGFNSTDYMALAPAAKLAVAQQGSLKETWLFPPK